MLETMTKIEIIGPKRYFYPVVGLLHQLGTVHLEDLSGREMGVRQMTVDENTEHARTELENSSIRLNGILDTIAPEKEEDSKKESIKIENDYYKEVWHKETGNLIEEADNLISELEERTRELASRKSDLELGLTTIDRYIDIMEKIKPLAKQIITLEGFETVAFLLERKYKDTLGAIREEMAHLTDNKYELVSADVDEDTTAALVIFHKQYSGTVHAFLSDNVNEVRLPPELRNRPFSEVVEEMNENKKHIPDQVKDIKKQLSKISVEWYHKLNALVSAINDRIDELQCVPQFGETDYTFVVDGWLPYKNLAETKKQVKKRFGEKVMVSQLELSHHDLEQAPVVINNPKWAKPFEIIMKIVQPPRYGTIDPTPLLAIFFPLLYGFIVGDMGYAIVIFLAATIMKRKFQKTNLEAGVAVCSIFQIGAGASFLFGVLFGEFFGNLLNILKVIKPIALPFKIPGMTHAANGEFIKEYAKDAGPAAAKALINKTTFPLGRETVFLIPFLFFSLAFGVVHLITGLSIGIINSVKEKATKHAFEKAGLLLVLVGVTVSVIEMAVLKTTSPTVGLILVGIGVVLVFYAAGPLSALEHVFGTLGNLFSYMRLIALGISGVILANVANLLAESFAKSGGIGIVIGILIGSMLHIINIAVASFSPLIHTIRLNIIEFFNRFYESGGHHYKPFKIRR